MRVSKECEIVSFYRIRKVFTCIDIAYTVPIVLYCIVLYVKDCYKMGCSPFRPGIFNSADPDEFTVSSML